MRILIADDHGLLIDIFSQYLEGTGEFTVESAADLGGALVKVRTSGPFDLVLLDFSMPGMRGLEGLRRILKLEQGPRVAIISGTISASVAREALSQGAVGIIPKDISAEEFIMAVRNMVNGNRYWPRSLGAEGDKANRSLQELLSPREMQVLERLTRGLSNKEIGRELEVSEATVKLHVKTLYRKIDAANRTQAAMIGRDAGLF
ncbi:response regulator transcription factor [Palleronia caenipelagi]|uniref:Response regulator transcription factor n=1 Tax=Palleronia caenipelagi TaxID=2489174 RepID=A0A547Q2Q7_9RHOB|nr:response regulator transcription factor [Palleronia caenipelagi]TRD20677.1 response regulator transcription factor [Palleronia caenipelagi]